MLKPSLPIALILAASAIPVAAAEPDQPPALRVFYGDLDLSTDDGRTTLDRRLRHAISRLCAPRDAVTALTGPRCRTAARASIASQRSTLVADVRENPAGVAAAGR